VGRWCPDTRRSWPGSLRIILTEHLGKLVDAGVLGRAELPAGERSRDLFDRNGIFDEDVWREQYEKVRKTPEFREVEGMDRPDQG